MPTEVIVGILSFLAGAVLVWTVLWSRAVLFWLRARSAGIPVEAGELVLEVMARRHSERCHDAWLMCREAGLDLPVAFFTGHHRSGGVVLDLGRALVAARRGGVSIEPHKLAAAALAGTDPLETVRRHLEPELAYNDPRTFGIEVGTSGILKRDAHPLGVAHLGTNPDFPVFAADVPIKAGTPVVVRQVHGNHVAVVPMAVG